MIVGLGCLPSAHSSFLFSAPSGAQNSKGKCSHPGPNGGDLAEKLH